jgi:multiple sugar transport system substrate-binding protein
VLSLWAAGREGEVVAELIPAFEASHPGVRVDVQQMPWTSAHEKLLTAVVGGKTPDVGQLGNTWIPEFATIGALTALDAQAAHSQSLRQDDYFPGIWDTNTFEGKLFGIPWYVDTRLLFYRTDLLEQAGFTRPPGSWTEWLTILRAIQKRGPPERAPLLLPLNEHDAALLAFALQQEEPLLRDGGRFGNFESAGFRRALEFFVSLFQAGLAPRIADTQIANLWDEFARGSFVFYIGAPFQIGNFKSRLPPALADDWMTAPLPGPDGPGSSLALGASLVVFEQSKNKALAWELIEHLSQPDVQRRFYELSGDLPSRRSSWQGESLASDAHAAAFREQLERVRPTPEVPEWERITTEVRILSERVARGTASVDATVIELDARVDRILEKRRWILDRRAAQSPAAKAEP